MPRRDVAGGGCAFARRGQVVAAPGALARTRDSGFVTDHRGTIPIVIVGGLSATHRGEIRTPLIRDQPGHRRHRADIGGTDGRQNAMRVAGYGERWRRSGAGRGAGAGQRDRGDADRSMFLT
jgi:hypothetical protein